MPEKEIIEEVRKCLLAIGRMSGPHQPKSVAYYNMPLVFEEADVALALLDSLSDEQVA